MNFADILERVTIITIGLFIIISIITFIYFNLRYKRDKFITTVEFYRSIVRLVASIVLGIFCFFEILELLDQPINWKVSTLFPLFIILNVSQFLNLSDQWAKYYRKSIHLSDL